MKKNEQNSLNGAAEHIHQQSAQITLTKLENWLGKTWRNVSTFMIDKSNFCYWSGQHNSPNRSGSRLLSLEEQRERLEQIYRDR